MEQAALIELVDRLCEMPREAATVEFKANWDAPIRHRQVPVCAWQCGRA